MRRLKIISVCLVVMLAVIGIAGFFIAPPLVRSVLTEQLSRTLKRPVAIRALRINPYALTASIHGFEIKEPSGQERFISFDELYLNLEVLSVFKRALILKEIRLTGPYVRIRRSPDSRYNFTDLLIRPAEERKKDERADAFLFSLNNIRIEKGSLDFWDGPNQTQHTVRDLKMAIPFISNMDHLAHRHTQPVLSATINGHPYLLRGRTKPFAKSLESDFELDIKDLPLPHYLAYVPMDLNFKLLSGRADTRLRIVFAESRKEKPSLRIEGDVTLKDLAIDDRQGRPLLRTPAVHVALAAFEPFTPLYHVGKLVISRPEVDALRNREGDFNLRALVPGNGRKEGQEKALRAGEVIGEKPTAPVPLPLQVDELRIESGKIRFRDETPSDPVSLVVNRLNLKVSDFSLQKDAGSRLELALELGRKGKLSAAGLIALNPFSTALTLELGEIDTRPFQGYVTDQVNIIVTSGAVSATGSLAVRDLGEKGLTAAYDGKFLLSRFSSLDERNGHDFLKWKSLFCADMHLGYNPVTLAIRQIALTDFYAGIVIDEDGILNLQSIFTGERAPTDATDRTKPPSSAEKGAEPEKDPERVVKIDAITLQGGNIDFLDLSVSPDFSARFSQIGGRVSGLSSLGEKPADIELRGKYNHFLPAEITGNIDPLSKNLRVDLKASFKGMDLSAASPYSGKYAGYNIQKGQLSFDLKYLIVNRKLEAENRIFIDQLTLGSRVESPAATKLPVELAIALLKDRKGEINLDIPLSGSLDDPQFSIFRLFIQVLVNLVTKAVTSPFALLGGLFGGGEELGYLEFEPGQETISEANRKKILTLARALRERPTLTLDIEGHVDPEKDREGLKKVQIERKMKARKLDEMVRRKLPAVSVTDVVIPPEEREKYLAQVYRAEPFAKPRNAIGVVKTLPVAEMEKLLLTHAVITDDALRLLANERASAVKDRFLETGQVTPDRIFLLEPKALPPEKKEPLRDSRVDFRLKSGSSRIPES